MPRDKVPSAYIVIDKNMTNFTKSLKIICAIFIDILCRMRYYQVKLRKGVGIMYRRIKNSDVDDMIYGSTVTVPSDR